MKRRAETRGPPVMRRYLLPYPGVLVRRLPHCDSKQPRSLPAHNRSQGQRRCKAKSYGSLGFKLPWSLDHLSPALDGKRLVCAPAHQRDENDGCNDGDDNRPDAAQTIGKECEHIALSHAAPTSRLNIYSSRKYRDQVQPRTRKMMSKIGIGIPRSHRSM